MIGYYNYTVILTYIGAVAGFIGITYSSSGNLKMALVCLMISGLCDMFDGKIASTMKRTKQEKRFGIQIDSLSDLVCFGVLPALIILHCSDKKIFNIVISALYMLCTLIRLSWFNVDEEERQMHEEKSREIYKGLPVTSSALLLPFFMGGSKLLHLPFSKISSWLLCLVAAAFLCPFSLKKPKLIGKILILMLGTAGFVMVIIGGAYV